MADKEIKLKKELQPNIYKLLMTLFLIVMFGLGTAFGTYREKTMCASKGVEEYINEFCDEGYKVGCYRNNTNIYENNIQLIDNRPKNTSIND